MTSALESMVVDEKQLPEKPVDREKVNNKYTVENMYLYIYMCVVCGVQCAYAYMYI